jgi:hypothetical protein
MDKENIKKEISDLKKIKNNWFYTQKNKSDVWKLISDIQIFNHTFSVNFPNSVKYYERNSFAEINISDGIKELRIYSNSKLKVKDDIYYLEGIKNVTNGLHKIILSLKEELNME